MNKFLYILGIALVCSLGVMAQQGVVGVVKDTAGNPLSGVRVNKVGEMKNNVVTNNAGEFSLSVEKDEYIELNYADILLKRVRVTDSVMNIVLDDKKDAMVDLLFTKRTEGTHTQSVSVIYADMLERNATATDKLNNAMYGLLPGLHTSQNVGWGAGASRQMRGGGGPLVLIDGFERGMSNIAIEEIESVQLLKDGAATALYGMRAANGVLLINTKRGIYNSFDIDVNYRHGFDFPINQPEMADAYTYAMAQNEALYYDGLPLQYNKKQLENYKNGTNPFYYPNVDWISEGMRNFSENNQFNVTLRGGGQRVRYLLFLDYQNKFGLLSEDYTHYSERYNSQIRDYDLNLRMNLDADVTGTTKMKFSIYGNLGEGKRPNTGVNNIFQNLYKVPAAAFPVKTAGDVWGSNTLFKMNPIAQIADVGYVQDNRRMLEADLRLTQDFSMWLKGLSAEVAVAYDNVAAFTEVGSKSYRYEMLTLPEYGFPTSQYDGNDTPLAISKSELSEQFIRLCLEGKLNYDRAFEKHQLNVSAIYRQEMTEPLGVNTSNYWQNILGVVGYNYDNRYMVDMVGNYYGSSSLLKGDKFRFYPAVSAAWNMANESFFENTDWLDLLKVRVSWGKSANDGGISPGMGNYYFTSGGGYAFGNTNTSTGGLKEGRLPISRLDIETSTKYNIGVDLRLWKNFTATAEFYHDRRTDILRPNNLVSGMLGISSPQSNVGEIKMHGVELSAGWSQRHKDFSYYINANWAFNDSEIVEYGEAYQPYDYLYKKGKKVDQLFGLEAIGYFRDDEDILKSPEQTFSTVRPGDVKYKDQNNDKKIDSYDFVPIGKSTSVPEMVFGLNLGFEYKGFGVDMTFNGVSGITKLLNVANVHQPLRNGNTNIATWYLKDKIRWTENTKDIANVPRLSTLSNSNNYQTSTQWMEDGSFFKLRNLKVHYTLPTKWTDKMRMDKLQLYVKALNVFSIDKIKYFNCESLSLGYPDLFSLYLGVNINF